MKITGISFVRNGIKFDYPIVEAIRSVLPVCDEFIVLVGNSEDGTLDLIKSLNEPKIRIHESVWDDSLREGGAVLAVETNKALDLVSEDTDWVFYIQGDEVFHEDDIAKVKSLMQEKLEDKNVDGLLFNYRHFYGSYDYIGDSRRWYRKEIRIVRNDKRIRSYKDAQGFRKQGEKLNVVDSGAHIHHYGWVKTPEVQQLKQQNFHKMWHSDQWMKENIPTVEAFDYANCDSVALFKGKHPMVMEERLKRLKWSFSIDPTKKNYTIKQKVLKFIEDLTGYRAGEYKNYKIVK